MSDHKESLQRLLNEFEEAAQEAVTFTRQVVKEFETDGVSPLWFESMQARAQESRSGPFDAMWKRLMAARKFALANGFEEVASVILPGVDSKLAAIIQ
jgi:hypothetical protein